VKRSGPDRGLDVFLPAGEGNHLGDIVPAAPAMAVWAGAAPDPSTAIPSLARQTEEVRGAGAGIAAASSSELGTSGTDDRA